jgi:hypothetical protein
MAGTLMPSSYGTRRDVAFSQDQRQQALLDELLAQEKMKTRLQDPLEKAHMEASVRNFEQRTGVTELGGGDFIDAPTPQPMRTIKRGSVDGMPPSGESARDFLTRTVPQFGSSPREVQNLGLHGDTGEPPTGRENVTTQFGTSPQTRTIRRFGSDNKFTDPDAAMGVEARARLAPGVLSSEIEAKGRTDAANIAAKSALDVLGPSGGMTKLSPGAKDDLATMKTVEDLGRTALELGEQTGWKGIGGMYQGSIAEFGTKHFGTGTPEEIKLRSYIGQIKGTIAKLRGGTSFTPNEQALLDTYTPGKDEHPNSIKAKMIALNDFIATKRRNTMQVNSRGGMSDDSDYKGDDSDPLGIR